MKQAQLKKKRTQIHNGREVSCMCFIPSDNNVNAKKPCFNLCKICPYSSYLTNVRYFDILNNS